MQFCENVIQILALAARYYFEYFAYSSRAAVEQF